MLSVDAVPLCADPVLLPLVDASFDRSKAGNKAAREIARLCPLCPAAAQCLRENVVRPAREGVWGGTRRMGNTLSGGTGPLKVVA